MFACVGCGREDHPYGADRCARCVLTERLTALLTDPGTGTVHQALQPLFDELAGADRPQSVLTWLTKPPATGARLLALMAQGQMPISHDTFRALPSDRSHNYLRELLASVGVLAPYQAAIERIERWLEAKLESLDADDAALVGRFARWQVLRRLRRGATDGEISKGSIDAARMQINAAVRLCAWAADHQVGIVALRQADLEAFLAAHPGSRHSQYAFVTWLRRSVTNTTLRLRLAPSTYPDVVVSDAQRWDQIETLLHDDTIRGYVRIGGLFMLLFAQTLTDICAMKAGQIDVSDDSVLVTFDATPVQMPPILDDLLREHLARPGVPSIASRDHGWLFGGRNPGRHLATENFRGELVAHGIHPGRSRNAALFGLAAELPAPVLADLIGVADKTARKWAVLAARDWAPYIARRGE